jgi:hypothetical protein
MNLTMADNERSVNRAIKPPIFIHAAISTQAGGKLLNFQLTDGEHCQDTHYACLPHCPTQPQKDHKPDNG